LNTHSDNFNGALGHEGGYRQVYYKTATMLYNLQYVLGDSLFLAAMQNYFDEWKIAHPYIEDFRNSIINFTHVDLNWFFDEWFETDKVIDYEIEKVKRINKNNDYEIVLEREGRMQMPIDLSVTLKNDSVLKYHIPNDWFVKNTSSQPSPKGEGAAVIVLPKWFGWDNLNEQYKFKINVPQKIKQVQIDPTGRLADIDRTNNYYKNKCTWSFDHRLYDANDWEHRTNYWRPDVWYNKVDGLKLGANINGCYVETLHKYSLSVWYNTGFFKNSAAYNNWIVTKFNYNFTYSTPLNNVVKGLETTIEMRYLDGLQLYKLGVEKLLANGKTTVKIYQKSFLRFYNTTNNPDQYLMYSSLWNYGQWNSNLNIELHHKYIYTNGTGNVIARFRTSSLGSANSYSYLNIESVNKNVVGKFDINTRFFAQYGIGVLPYESALYAAGANPEQMMENKYTRSRAFINDSYSTLGNTTNHFQYGGGLNLRGYNGYLLPTNNSSNDQIYLFNSKSGAAINTEIGFDRLFKIRAKKLRNWLKINTYAFADAGVLAYDNFSSKFSPLRIDAGLGSTVTIKKWWVLEKTIPLVVRFDFPFFLNTPPYDEGKYVKFRWLISLERAF